MSAYPNARPAVESNGTSHCTYRDSPAAPPQPSIVQTGEPCESAQSDAGVQERLQRCIRQADGDAVLSFRFLPAAYLTVCGSVLDRGAEQLLYVLSLISEEI